MLLFGRNIFKEAIAAKASILEVFVETKSAYDWLTQTLGTSNLSFKIQEGIPPELRKENHQGIAFRTNHEFYKTYDAVELRRHNFIVLCNHLEDVHNLGSIARCAAAFGATLIVHENSKSASVTPAVVKSSVGCAFKISFMKVESLEPALKVLQKSDYEIAGLDINSQTVDLYQWNPSDKLAVLLGSEGTGIEASIKAYCQRFVKVPMQTGVESLNVSHAASVVMSWAHHHRRKTT